MDRDVYQRMRALQGEHWWFRARRRILATLIAGLDLPADARILEAGCGSGGNIALLQKFGRVSAFDMDEEAAGYCRADTGISCRVGSLPFDNPYQDDRGFDLVVSLDVLEHIDDDRASLVSLASCLGEGGRLLLAVPAYQWMFSSHDRIHHHKRRYDRVELETLVKESGLVVRRSGYFNTILFPLIACVRLLSKLLGRDSGSDMKMPGRWSNALLTGVFGAEANVLRYAGFPFGTSIFLVATRADQDAGRGE